MKLGDLRIHYLNGGITHIDGGAMFGVVPKALWTRKYEVNDKNQIPLPTHPILIQSNDYNIIIDTGIGSGKLTDKERRNFGAHYESQISEDLKALDLTTADIDYVLMTHLHFDHAAGLTDNEGNSIFNKAIHVIQQDEWHEFQSPNIRSKSTYWPKNNGDFKKRLLLFENEIEIVPGIKMIHTGGHSFGHAIITIESQNEKAVHMGDIFPTTAHRNPLWVTAYDDYPMQSIREKESLVPYYIHQNYWFLYYHDVNYFAVKFDKQNITEFDTFISRN
ncbi:YtnP family quorum-quenching lactonase [Staphylococcus saprophyticus]|uniref:YtnP family quorum-quenching lactonase n=1 Tax=Staphylococcus saprophyticus TaxID=29385 RepID=UPI001F35F995|nr:MBL fold metallo-hydrolase [Staphylococcus saprophyticus]MCE5131680.1 MBL fold metallo-hydrolase [Staphylococcus saprophyticus]WMM16163.1 MBL fold metallo-hydrolase [Staphylococcus saprophyticus]